MATKRSDVKDLVNSDMAARNLPTKASEREEDSDELVARTFMISSGDLKALKAYAKREGISLNAAARIAIKRLLRNS
jgi:NRPS condensation-like uncharacterized protein